MIQSSIPKVGTNTGSAKELWTTLMSENLAGRKFPEFRESALHSRN